MDFLRTLKKRRPKKHVTARVSAVSPAGGVLKRRTCYGRRRREKFTESGLSE
jgi:hypothetical protein